MLRIIAVREKSDEYFPSVNYLTHLNRYRELFYRAWSDGQSICEMSVNKKNY